jgi:hypothetical protein
MSQPLLFFSVLAPHLVPKKPTNGCAAMLTALQDFYIMLLSSLIFSPCPKLTVSELRRKS